MAEDTKPVASKPEAPKTTPTSPHSRILKQGTVPSERFGIPAAVDAELAGNYRITHGNMSFGYEKGADGLSGAPILAHQGAVVQLTAAEATAALAAATAVRVSA